MSEEPSYREAATALVDRTLSGVTIDSAEYTDHHRGETVIVKLTDGDDLIVKFFAPDHGDQAAKEATLHQQIRHATEVPVPRVVAMAREPEDTPYPYIITEFVPGVHPKPDAMTTDALASVVRQLGRHHGAWHAALDFDRFGWIDHTAHAVTDRWSAWMADVFLEQGIERLSDTPFGDLQSDAMAFIEGHRDALNGNFDSVLVHDDYSMENVLLTDRTEVTALIDFERAIAAPAEYGYARARWAFGPTITTDDGERDRLQTAYRAGYAATNDVPAGAEFRERSRLYDVHSAINDIQSYLYLDGSDPRKEEALRAKLRETIHAPP